MTKVWISTDGVPHFGIWHENIKCLCSSTHILKKQYESMLDPAINKALDKLERTKNARPKNKNQRQRQINR
jgi:hypothetical protein